MSKSLIYVALSNELKHREMVEIPMQLDIIQPKEDAISIPEVIHPPTSEIVWDDPAKEMRGELAENQLISLEEPTPIQFDSRECNREVEGRASSWVQQKHHQIKQEYGTLFDGFEKEAEVLLEKLDQRRGLTKEPIHDNQLVPKEVRNFIFEVKYKDGEPRSELRKGRRPSISDQ